MGTVNLQGQVEATYRSQLDTAVQEYAAKHPNVSHADGVELNILGPDGKPCDVKGTFQRTFTGELVFVVLGVVGKAVAQAVGEALGRAFGPNAKRAARKASREGNALSAGLEAIYNGTAGKTAEEVYDHLQRTGLIKTEGKKLVMAGGREKFANKAAALEYLRKVVPAIAADNGDTKNQEAAAATKAAPAKKVARKAARVAKRATKVVAKAAKKAAKK